MLSTQTHGNATAQLAESSPLISRCLPMVVFVVNNGAFFFDCGEFNDTPLHRHELEVNCLSGALFSSIQLNANVRSRSLFGAKVGHTRARKKISRKKVAPHFVVRGCHLPFMANHKKKIYIENI